MATAQKALSTSTKKHSDTPRAVIYARVSDDKAGQASSVEQQQEAGRDLITRRGWNLVTPIGAVEGAFVDNSITGTGKKHRPAFYAMLDAVRRGEVDAIVARHQDRLARNPRERLALVEACREHCVIIALVQGTDMDPTTASGRVVIGVLGEIAEMEIALKSERHVAALHRHAKAGKVPHGRALMGYTTAGEVVPDEAEIVRRVFAGFIAGESLRSLARALTEDGVPTRSGRPWNTRTVRDILSNPRYAGWVLYQREILTDENGNRLRGQWEPLVDADDFDVVQARLSDPARKTNHVGTHRRYLGSNLFVCDECSTPVETVNGGKYTCRGHLMRDHAPVDEFVIDVIAERLSRPDFADLLAPDAADVKPLTDAARRLRSRLEVADNDYAAGDIDAKLLKKTKSVISAELAEVESKLAAMTSTAALGNLAGAANPAAAFRAASAMGQRAIIAALCDVRLRKAARGRPAKHRFFDTSTVEILWKHHP
ncbi:MAG: recombinase family protein [Mycobacterium sp.]|nr:recombinase family protein [Mycobacterium sp.]